MAGRCCSAPARATACWPVWSTTPVSFRRAPCKKKTAKLSCWLAWPQAPPRSGVRSMPQPPAAATAASLRPARTRSKWTTAPPSPPPARRASKGSGCWTRSTFTLLPVQTAKAISPGLHSARRWATTTSPSRLSPPQTRLPRVLAPVAATPADWATFTSTTPSPGALTTPSRSTPTTAFTSTAPSPPRAPAASWRCCTARAAAQAAVPVMRSTLRCRCKRAATSPPRWAVRARPKTTPSSPAWAARVTRAF